MTERYLLITKEPDALEKEFNLLYFQERKRMFKEIQKRVGKNEEIIIAGNINEVQTLDFTELQHDTAIHCSHDFKDTKVSICKKCEKILKYIK